jgi:hypothetical protein
MSDLNTFLELARSTDKNDRKSAAEGLGELDYKYQKAVNALQKLTDDNERGVRRAAEKALNNLLEKPSPPEDKKIKDPLRAESQGYSTEVGDSSLQKGQYAQETSLTPEQEAQLKKEAEGKGVKLVIKEENKVVVDSQGNFVSREKGIGSVVIQNTGEINRIFGIDLELTNLKGIKPVKDKSVLEEAMAIGELDAQETWETEYEFETEKEPVKVNISYMDPETKLLPNFRANLDKPTPFLATIEINNTTKEALTNLVVDVGLGDYGKGIKVETSVGEGKIEEKSVIVEIPELAAGGKATLNVNIEGKLPEGVDAYETGEIRITYDEPYQLFSGMDFKHIDGISDLKRSLRRKEREEEPGVYDCELHFQNLSEFVYDMIKVNVYAGNIDEKTVLVDWDGLTVSEKERSLVPTEMNDFEFVYESDDGAPTFGNDVVFTVKTFTEKFTQTTLTIPTERLKFLALGMNKVYRVTEVPSYRETTIPVILRVKGIGTYPLEALIIKDSIPPLFSDVNKKAIEVFLNGKKLTGGYKIDGQGVGTGPADIPAEGGKTEGKPLKEEKTSEQKPKDEKPKTEEKKEEKSKEDTPKDKQPKTEDDGEFAPTTSEEPKLMGKTFEISFENLHENVDFESQVDGETLKGFKEGDIIEVKYPISILKPARGSLALKGAAYATGFVYAAPETKVYSMADAGITGITVIHNRVDIDISKTIQGVKSSKGEKAYKITLEGNNFGNAPASFTIKDLIPKGFNLDGASKADPPVKEVEDKPTEKGSKKMWKFENIAPNSMFTVTYVIVGEQGSKYNPKDAQIMAQG